MLEKFAAAEEKLNEEDDEDGENEKEMEGYETSDGATPMKSATPSAWRFCVPLDVQAKLRGFRFSTARSTTRRRSTMRCSGEPRMSPAM
jgi:hypothetical protein